MVGKSNFWKVWNYISSPTVCLCCVNNIPPSHTELDGYFNGWFYGQNQQPGAPVSLSQTVLYEVQNCKVYEAGVIYLTETLMQLLTVHRHHHLNRRECFKAGIGGVCQTGLHTKSETKNCCCQVCLLCNCKCIGDTGRTV